MPGSLPIAVSSFMLSALRSLTQASDLAPETSSSHRYGSSGSPSAAGHSCVYHQSERPDEKIDGASWYPRGTESPAGDGLILSECTSHL